MVQTIPYPACDSGEQQIVAPALQPSNQIPQRHTHNRFGESNRIEARISKILDEEQAICVRVGGFERGERRTSGTGQCRLGLPDALLLQPAQDRFRGRERQGKLQAAASHRREQALGLRDRKSTRLNSSHGYISYAVFCLKKKKNNHLDDSLPCILL